MTTERVKTIKPEEGMPKPKTIAEQGAFLFIGNDIKKVYSLLNITTNDTNR